MALKKVNVLYSFFYSPGITNHKALKTNDMRNNKFHTPSKLISSLTLSGTYVSSTVRWIFEFLLSTNSK
jgi:hypothetical protein